MARKMHRNGVNPEAATTTPDDAPQRIVKVRRDYNSWVASE
eukprot:gene43966-58619_t